MLPTQEPGLEGQSQGAEPSDHSLLRRLRGGSQDAATQLYLRYADRLRALTKANWFADLSRRVDIEDIVQSVFGSFFRGASRGYYDVPAGDELWKLFLVIALNKIRAKGAYHRAAKRDVRLTAGSEDLEGLPEVPVASDEVAYAVLQMTVDEALEHLPQQHKQMLILRIEGHEVAAIARETGRSKRTIERVLQECRKRLGELLDRESCETPGSPREPARQGS
jgi:RNA polymerase sigma-70 factor (ECF subfamily)